MGDITFYNEIEGLQVWQIDECPSTFQILDLVSTPNSSAKAVFTFNQTDGKGQEGRRHGCIGFDGSLDGAAPLARGANRIAGHAGRAGGV